MNYQYRNYQYREVADMIDDEIDRLFTFPGWGDEWERLDGLERKDKRHPVGDLGKKIVEALGDNGGYKDLAKKIGISASQLYLIAEFNQARTEENLKKIEKFFNKDARSPPGPHKSQGYHISQKHHRG